MKAIAILAASVLLSAGACSAAGKPYWLKTWSFGEISGSKEAKAGVTQTGATQLGLEPDRVIDPLYEGCPAGANYDDIKHRSRAELARHFGTSWRFPATLDAPASVAGWIRCKGVNVAPVAFVNPSLGYRFFEEGIVITLH
ncbi:hypothetical protein ACSBM8_13275 [Sphingomonas sp. ASY06-1R]|uniref:hypothetical protein n=1 Tax=Sphingomonas sp. ASY06-1R TaxID=3445771 RepID=UPI003FA2329E